MTNEQKKTRPKRQLVSPVVVAYLIYCRIHYHIPLGQISTMIKEKFGVSYNVQTLNYHWQKYKLQFEYQKPHDVFREPSRDEIMRILRITQYIQGVHYKEKHLDVFESATEQDNQSNEQVEDEPTTITATVGVINWRDDGTKKPLFSRKKIEAATTPQTTAGGFNKEDYLQK